MRYPRECLLVTVGHDKTALVLIDRSYGWLHCLNPLTGWKWVVTSDVIRPLNRAGRELLDALKAEVSK